VEDLRPFSPELPAYTAYGLLVQRARLAAKTFDGLAWAIRRFAACRAARLAAQGELQRVYDHVAFGLRLPRLPVRLPLRKRPYNRGAAVTYSDGRYEIRVWVLHAPPKKRHDQWQPADLGITSPYYLSEVLLHEIAHIRQSFSTGASDHGQGFVHSYLVVESVFLGFGFGPLLPSKFRFTGCPPESEAAKLQGTPRPAG
jgi:hypothetical protein